MHASLRALLPPIIMSLLQLAFWVLRALELRVPPAEQALQAEVQRIKTAIRAVRVDAAKAC